ncbi:hypothetical protein F5Y07DRAFT_400148 [Xylaria sp. FL0933]|nr:hypothetical protein F5Y07DRAFT_400148 [Xylaria sp. FL0933]
MDSSWSSAGAEMTSEEIAEKYLSLKGPGRAMYAYTYYSHCFESADEMRDRIPKTNIPGPGYAHTSPWIVEAPLNSVEVLEALFKPARHLQIFTARHIPCTARHIPQGPAGSLRRYNSLKSINLAQKTYREFTQFQGRLTEDREISFVCIPEDDIDPLRERLAGRFCPVQLCYISIPWQSNGRPTITHPWALLYHGQPRPAGPYSYEGRFNTLLDELNLTGCGFERSLLKPGTTPLPECLWDWYVGVPGHSAALPYYAADTGGVVETEDGSARVLVTETKEDVNESGATDRHHSAENVMSKDCLMK